MTDDVLAAARRGDGEAFRDLVGPHLRALHLHCYRMLGSYVEADDAVQDALLSAWRGLDGYQERAPLPHWLHRIATTTCLKAIHRRARSPESTVDISWLQPYPDARLADVESDPAAIVDRRESVALAFIAALQLLPASQRAALILHDVLAWSSREVADLLDTTVAGVNSVLQRARATVGRDPAPGRDLDERERAVMAEFVQAWNAADIPALAEVLRADATLTMPPQSVHLAGRDAVTQFFATVPADGRLDLFELVWTRANGDPALAAYLPDEAGGPTAYGIMVFTVVGGGIATITGFADQDLFTAFDLPASR